MLNGFIVVDKPAGMTSHDVVSAVRRIARMKKVGHTGTLDPFATGVLPVALGEGTKAIPFLEETVKEYRAVMRLGASTDTQDFTGRETMCGVWQGISPETIDETSRSFIGRGTQVPPMYSALKRDGVPLYKLARKGEEVHREPRGIEIISLEIERFVLPDVSFTVRCSRGTYVRTLANDIGARLGCGAHLVELRRTASGLFGIDHAVSLEELASAGEGERLHEHLVGCYPVLEHLPACFLTAQGAQRVGRGIIPEADDFLTFSSVERVQHGLVRLCLDGVLVAVAEKLPWGELGDEAGFRLRRVFNEH